MISLNQAPSTMNQEPLPIIFQKGSVSAAREQTNPLRSLTIARAVSLMESAQRGDFLELQWLYWFVEQTEAVLFALQERRYGRLAEMDWQIKTISADRRRASFDESLAEEQSAALAEQYDRVDNLKAAVEHLASATFRMFAHVNIQRDPAGAVAHLEPLDQWNFLREGMFGDWYWNPEANCTSVRQLPAANKIVPEDFIIRNVSRHIDRLGLLKYIRKNLGEKDWSAFLEIYGIPTPLITMPPNATETQKSLYEAAGRAISEGRAVALPNGCTATFPDGTRGTSPFSEYLKWCDEQIVLIGTGGLLSMLSMPQGIGSGGSDVHDAAFQSIAKAEAFRISELLQTQLDKPFLAQAFPGRPVLAYFEISAQESTDPGVILDHAVKAKNAGLAVDPDELSELTGYTLTLAPPPPSGGPTSVSAVPVLNSEVSNLQSQISSSLSSAQLNASATNALAAAMSTDLAPLRERIAAALALEDNDAMVAALQAIQTDLPAILAQILANPASEQVLTQTSAAALLNGLDSAAKERKVSP
jgi:phage gp29-like protein